MPHPRSLLRPKEAAKEEEEGEKMRERELPLVLSRGRSEVTALAGGIWATAGGK